jgi:hypothetical protein
MNLPIHRVPILLHETNRHYCHIVIEKRQGYEERKKGEKTGDGIRDAADLPEQLQ